jgi:hypothetical protein
MKERKISSSLMVQQRIMRKEVKYNMKDGQSIRKWSGYWLITIFGILLTLLMAPMTVLAVDCAAPSAVDDYDQDGFSDELECLGITLYGGDIVPGALDAVPRAERLDPESKDLFVILAPATPSNIPTNPLEYLIAPEADGGLPVVMHIIASEQADPTRRVSPASSQRAVKVTEDLDISNMDVLGIANYGTPNGLDLATVYTERIKEHVNSVCSGASTCNDVDEVTIGASAVIDKYIKHTIAHEVAHNTVLTNEYNDRFGGYHYKTGSNTVLDQSVKYISRKGVVTWYIGSKFVPADQTAVRLY